MADEANLDLVNISPKAEPPVCRIMDYGKYRFERDKKEKEAKKRQTVVEVKEIQLSCRIDTHDFETKVKHAHRFIGDGNKVRVVVKFKGREMSHLEIGRDILAKFEEADAADCAVKLEGWKPTASAERFTAFGALESNTVHGQWKLRGSSE